MEGLLSWKAQETVRATFIRRKQGLIIHRANKENVPTRAYIAFKTLEQLQVFGREYDDHKFVDKAGMID
jgi:regulator of nonsense transcripts 3